MILFHQRGKAQKSFNKTKEISTYTLPDDNGTLAIAGNIGSTAIIALVEKPSILYPSNGSSEYDNSITISQYVNNYLYTGTKTHTTIQVSTDSNFNNIVVNNFIPDTDTNARDISLPLDYSNTTLYIRIRYHSGDYCSMWSDTVSVRTKTFIVSIPTILTPSNNLEGMPVNLLITTSDFNYIGVSDTHYSTHYQVSTNAAFTSLYYNVESTTSLKSAATTLKEGTTYYIRVRYRGTKYGYSSWSNVIRISTLVPIVLHSGAHTYASTTPNHTQFSYFAEGIVRFTLSSNGTWSAYALTGYPVLYYDSRPKNWTINTELDLYVVVKSYSIGSLQYGNVHRVAITSSPTLGVKYKPEDIIIDLRRVGSVMNGPMVYINYDLFIEDNLVGNAMTIVSWF